MASFKNGYSSVTALTKRNNCLKSFYSCFIMINIRLYDYEFPCLLGNEIVCPVNILKSVS